jgi:two-component system chemotaxis response regulator CheY
MATYRVLLVDDSAEFLEMAARFLEAEPPVQVVGRALSAREGLRMVVELRPDLVLMDLAMPDMNGLDATRGIKAMADPPRVVILTLFDSSEYRAAAEEARADGFIPKSEFAEKLLPLIRTFLAPQEGPESYKEAPVSQILVVDDSRTIRRMVMASLQALSGGRFSEAASGLEAIEQLALRAVDLMILDLNMPDMHGMEVVRFVRSHAAYRQIPILVLTTKGDDASRMEALEAGATRYMTKPFDPRVLLTQVQEILLGGGGRP